MQDAKIIIHLKRNPQIIALGSENVFKSQKRKKKAKLLLLLKLFIQWHLDSPTIITFEITNLGASMEDLDPLNTLACA